MFLGTEKKKTKLQTIPCIYLNSWISALGCAKNLLAGWTANEIALSQHISYYESRSSVRARERC